MQPARWRPAKLPPLALGAEITDGAKTQWEAATDYRPPLPTLAALRWSYRTRAECATLMKRKRPLPPHPGPTESELHLSVANFLDWVLVPPAMYSTFPSGWGVLTPSMAQRLKRSGLKAGMPDMLVFPGNGRCFGIELKAGKNGLSDVQRDTFEQLRVAGVRVVVCRSLDHVMVVLKQEDVPMRSLRGSSWPGLQKHDAPLLEEISARRDAGVEAGGTDGAENREAG